jgi:hypothetical protein
MMNGTRAAMLTMVNMMDDDLTLLISSIELEMILIENKREKYIESTNE